MKDYTKQPLLFNIKKAVRYVQMYGLQRTLIKVESHYHMKKKYDSLPDMRNNFRSEGHVGIIGCGKFAFGNIAYYLRKNYGYVIGAAMDINTDRAASLYEKYKLNYYTDNAEKLISDPALDMVFIASNHASHAEYAIMALEMGKSVHIEKPHAVSEDQLIRLCSAMSRSEGKVAIGFNRPNSKFGREIKRYMDSQSGPAMYNWFVAGHEIPPEHWYFNEEEGGRVLGNLCHWTDFVYQIVPPENRYPITIKPARWEKPDSNIAVTYIFGDGSIATIMFSEKSEPFEGIKERFVAHRGKVLISMYDFKHMLVEVAERKHTIAPLFRNHGHEERICSSYEMVRPKGKNLPGCPISYVWETGQLFLKTKEALEENRVMTLAPYDQSFPKNATV